MARKSRYRVYVIALSGAVLRRSADFGVWQAWAPQGINR